MEIISKSIFKLLHNENSYEELQVIDIDVDFNDYLKELLIEIINDSRSKNYNFPKHDTGIKSIINKLVKKKYDEAFESSVQRLLQKETVIRYSMAHLIEVHEGVLIQAYVKLGDEYIYIITKADEFEYINKETKKKNVGFPKEKKVFKSFCGYLDTENKLLHAKVSDSNSVISAYWWREFLELELFYTNEENSKNFIDLFEKKVLNKIKKESKPDHTYLKNSAIHYLRTNKEMVLKDFANKIFDNYVPVDTTFKPQKYKDILLEIPEKNKLDSRFEIDQKSITIRKSSERIKLDDALILEINNYFDIKGLVDPIKIDGEKYLQIRTDNGYDSFKIDNDKSQ
jgi:hypothetical protein